jgi:AAHS family 4-hydroxybenzoate transporter-like MFS transporter
MQPRINVSDVIDNSRLGAFQIGIFILCGLCLIMDGYDVQAIGYVAPSLREQWKIAPALLGSVLTAALVGVMFGSILLSMLADRIGRRPVLVGACLFFAAVTLVTGFVQNVTQLLIIRFIGGVAMGSIMPNAMALVDEYSPRRIRVAAMMIVGNGFTFGAALGGIVAFWLIPAFGWRSVFYVGGAIPLLIGVLMLFALPESIRFLALHGKQRDQIARWLRRVDPALEAGPHAEFTVRERREAGVPFVKLFQEGRTPRTLLLWTVYFMNLLNLYFLSSWLPTVTTPMVNAAKLPGYYAVLLGSTLQIAGSIGAIILPWFVHRLGFVPVLATGFTLACINIALIGQPGLSIAFLFLVVFLAGLGIVGGQTGVNALAGTLYPTNLRSTGIGAGLGVGRIGSIVGPQVAGVLIGLHWSTHALFLTAAVPAFIASVTVIAMHFVVKPEVPAHVPVGQAIRLPT